MLTVDCGTAAHEPLAVARDSGLDVVVVDHHTAEVNLPAAIAVVNPNRLDDESGEGHLAAVGVAFLLVVAVNRELRRAGWYADRTEPDLTQWLDLVALGTVCDVVPLRGLNRLIRLRANGNQVRQIEVLLELQALVTVDLRDNPLDEDGLEALLQALEEAKVRVAL